VAGVNHLPFHADITVNIVELNIAVRERFPLPQSTRAPFKAIGPCSLKMISDYDEERCSIKHIHSLRN
jgi:hypothetical protein